MLPSYLAKLNTKELIERSEMLHDLMKECRLCPNECKAERAKGETGLCHSTDEVLVSSYNAHFGEEPPISGFMGSGTIFFTNCNLSCVYCQNFDISQLRHGTGITTDQLAGIMLNLQNSGCHNINFVSPTHFVPQIVDALIIAIKKGLQIPLVYNCGGYESIETLKLLDGIIDIYMPDVKYSDSAIGEQYSGVISYWETVKTALKDMHRQVGNLKLNKREIAESGILIRHLVLPNKLAGTFDVLKFIADEISVDTYVNIMDQYHPVYKADQHSELNRYISKEEYGEAVDFAKKLGLTRGLEI